MEGDPRTAAQAVHQIRNTLHDTLLALMGREDIQAARRRLNDAVFDIHVAIDELDALAHVNGLGGNPYALAGEDDGSSPPPRCRDGRCPDDAPCINSCGTGQCSRCCTVCRRLAGTGSVPCPACPDRDVRCPPGIPGSDLLVELDKPVTVPGAMTTGEVDRGVTVTHTPTGFRVRSEDERSQMMNRARALELLALQPAVAAYAAGQRCTHGGDCMIHPGTGGLHNYGGLPASDLPVHRIPGDKRDPR